MRIKCVAQIPKDAKLVVDGNAGPKTALNLK